MKNGMVRYLLASLGMIVMVMALVLGGISTYFFLTYKPQLSQLRNAHFKMKKGIIATIDSEFPVGITFDHQFQVRFHKDIPVEIPIKAKLKVPIDETLHIPITDSFSVKLDRSFSMDEKIQVHSELPLDTNIHTRFMGMDFSLPVRGSVPIDMTVPLKQDMGIKGEIFLHVTEPLPVIVQHILDVPIDLVVKGVLPVDQVITVPIDTTMDGEITIRDKLPCTVELDVSTEDWGRGMRIIN
jgi:hypothetical protein